MMEQQLLKKLEELEELPPPPHSVTAIAITGSKKSKYIVEWALEKFASEGQVFFKFIHVRPVISWIPTPMGKYIPISEVQNEVAAAYRGEMEWHINEKLFPLVEMCHKRQVQVEILKIESNDIETAIAMEILKNKISKLVIGHSSRSIFSRGTDLSSRISQSCPNFCTVYAISKGKSSLLRLSDSETNSIIQDELSIDTSRSSTGSSSNALRSRTVSKQTDQGSKGSFALSRSTIVPAQRIHAFTTIKKNHLHIRTPSNIISKASSSKSLAGASEDQSNINLELGKLVLCSRKRKTGRFSTDSESSFECNEGGVLVNSSEDLIKFHGGEDLSVQEILDTPGEVIRRSSYGTLYKASSVDSNLCILLRFLKPTCTLRVKEVVPIVRLLGSIRHTNLVPLNAFYAGPRDEKLMIHPFYESGDLAQFIRDGNSESRKWSTICRISIGIARGITHLQTTLEKPIIHGNLKSSNILLDHKYQPYISDFGLHLLLNLTSTQEMLEASLRQGYKAPELMKMKEANEDSDIYSLGVILLELLTGKEPVDENLNLSQNSYLPSALRSAILDDPSVDLYHPDILLGMGQVERATTEFGILRYFQLAMACCSDSRALRPDIKQVLEILEEIEKYTGKHSIGL